VAIGTDYIGSYKSNYHTITTPSFNLINVCSSLHIVILPSSLIAKIKHKKISGKKKKGRRKGEGKEGREKEGEGGKGEKEN
jgi:hypothetical protein